MHPLSLQDLLLHIWHLMQCSSHTFLWHLMHETSFMQSGQNIELHMLHKFSEASLLAVVWLKPQCTHNDLIISLTWSVKRIIFLVTLSLEAIRSDNLGSTELWFGKLFIFWWFSSRIEFVPYFAFGKLGSFHKFTLNFIEKRWMLKEGGTFYLRGIGIRRNGRCKLLAAI